MNDIIITMSCVIYVVYNYININNNNIKSFIIIIIKCVIIIIVIIIHNCNSDNYYYYKNYNFLNNKFQSIENYYKKK